MFDAETPASSSPPPLLAPPPSLPSGGERRFLPAEAPAMTGVPVGLAPPRRAPGPRDLWLRVALFCTVLGAVLTVIYAWVLARQEGMGPPEAVMPGYHAVIVPLLAMAAVAGALILERAPARGMALLLLGTGLGLGGGAIYLIPGALAGCVWAARHSTVARTCLGFLLLLPGIAAGYYGIMATLSYRSGLHVAGLPLGFDPPATLAEAMSPLRLLPLALLGAWLLTQTKPARRF